MSSRFRAWAGALGGAFLGLVLLVAAFAKALDLRSFAEQIHAQDLDAWIGHWPAAGTLAYLVLAVETTLGVLLVLGVRRVSVLAPTVALTVLFLFLTGRDAWRDSHGLLPADAACGCFGNLVERTPAEAFRQDLLLLVPALALAFVGRSNQGSALPKRRLLVATIVAAGTLLFAVKAPALPLDNLATRLRPGVAVSETCAGRDPDRVCLDAVVPEFGRGAHLAIVADLADTGTGAAVAKLNAYAQSQEVLAGSAPQLWVLAAATPEQSHTFYWSHGPTFEIRAAPPALLRSLARSLPRAFLVRDGRVAETWSGWAAIEKSTALARPLGGR